MIGAICAGIGGVVFAGLSALHVYWGRGGLWPGTSVASLEATVVGSRTGTMPGPAASYVVAGLLGVAGVAPLLARWGSPDVSRVAVVLAAGAAGVLALRGVGGFFDRWIRPDTVGQPFERLNLRVYSPLCLGLSAALLGALLA